MKSEFLWSRELRNVGKLESSYYWAYFLTQIPGGIIADKWRATLVFGTAIVVSAFLNLFIPAAAEIGYGLLIFVRTLQGLVEGVTLPACHSIWRSWAPPLERTRLATLAFTGIYGGALVGVPMSGWLADSVNWRSPFYVYGLSGLTWYMLWLWLVFEKPTINVQELNYIENSIGPQSDEPSASTTTPWKEIFKSQPVYAILLASFCHSWSFYILFLSWTIFFNDVFDFSISAANALTPLPNLLLVMIVPVSGISADYLRRTNILTTIHVRKLFTCGAFGLELIFFILIGICIRVSDGKGLVIILIAIATGCSGFTISGFKVNHLDIAPRYAGILMGFSNGVENIAWLVCPHVLQRMTWNDTPQEWSNVFFVAALINVLGLISYGIYASGDAQPWAEPQREHDEDSPQPCAISTN